jgi:hypothetical protein
VADQNQPTDEERREAYGWCPKCGAGNDREGYAHLSTCPTLGPQTTSYLLIAKHPDGRFIKYYCSTEEERECLREWVFAELEWDDPARSSAF